MSLPKTVTLTDNFTTLNTATKWVPASGISANGNLHCDNAFAVSRNRYDLTASRVKVEVTNPGSSFVVAAVDSLAAGSEATRSGGLFVGDGTDLVAYTSDWSGYNVETFDAVAHRFLRIRESAGNIRFETSPDDSSWSLFLSVAAASDGVLVALGGTGCSFDNLNI